MRRAAGRALRWAGATLLGLLAAAGLAVSGAALLAAVPVTRPLVAAVAVRWVDEQVAGRLELEGIAVLPHGGVELRGLRVHDPAGRLVLRVERARIHADATALAERTIGVSAELDGADVDAFLRTEDGDLALASAFGPARPGARREGKEAGAPPGSEGAPSPWTFRLSRLEVRHARVRAPWVDGSALQATDVSLDARGLWAPREAWVEARLAGTSAAPFEGPLVLEVRAAQRGDRVELQRLAVGLGPDRLEAVGEGDLRRQAGRAAITRLGLSRREGEALVPEARLGGDVAATAFAESDGAVASGAVTVVPEPAEGPGRAALAAAVRLPPAAVAWGFHADVDRLDPSRLSRLAPPGRVTLRGRGGARSLDPSALSGNVALRLERSRLRGGELGPVDLVATASRGVVDVTRLDASAPGGAVDGRLRWREGGAVSGELRVAAADLDRLGRNLSALLGEPLPPLRGSGRAAVTLSGTSTAPRLDAEVDAPLLEVADVRAEGARLRVALAGPAATVTGRVQGELASARAGGVALRAVSLDARLGEEEASLAFTARVPDLGPDPVRAMARGRFGPKRRSFDLADLAVAWPETTFALERPAHLDLEPLAVDRLALAAGAQRIEAQGGLRRGGALDARVRLQGLDLARLPRGLLPPDSGIQGILTADARVSGTRAAPRVDATVGLTGAAAYEVGGLEVLGEVAWDGGEDRAEADLGLVRARGGTLDVSLDLPLAPGRARPAEPLRVEVRGRALPIDELVWLAGSYALVSGDLDVAASLGGTVGAPTLAVTAAARNGTWDDLEDLSLDAALDAAGDRVRLRASGALSGAQAATVDAALAADLPAWLVRPREAAAAARTGALTAALRVVGVDLARLAGRLELPADLAGRVTGEANLAGSAAAPRGTARVELAGGAGWGVAGVAARGTFAAEASRSGATLDLRLAGAPAARVEASIGLAVERLADRAAVRDAPFRVDARLPRSDLAAWGGDLVRLGGAVEGRAALEGTPGAPRGEASLSATDAAVEGRPLGAVSVEARYSAHRATVTAALRPRTGGALRADLAVDRPLGLGEEAGPLLASPAELHVRAERLDLGFLPAVAPGVIRAASGAAAIDLSASGPLRSLRPRGTIRIADGRVAVAELGDWTGAALEATFGDDAIVLDRLSVRKGAGRLDVHGAVRGLAAAGAPAQVELAVAADDFGVDRAGMEFAKFTFTAEGRGTLTRDELLLGLVVPQAEVQLPKRVPRTLQAVETRKDITVGRPRPERPRRPRRGTAASPAAQAAAGPAGEPFHAILHLVAPRRLRIRDDQPRIDVELKADATLAFAGSRMEAAGTVEAVRGQVEPIGGRVFSVERAKVAFPGGAITAGVLDVVARYDNPTAVVRATVGGTLGRPQLRLASEPPLQESQIAMLVATGRTDVKAGMGGVGTLTAGDAGLAAAGALAMGVFKELLTDKLPFDSFSLDSTAVTTGKYLTDRIYVGYVRKFEAKPEKGENPDEVRFEYQIAPGWQVETRYGSAQSGSASIVWTRSY